MNSKTSICRGCGKILNGDGTQGSSVSNPITKDPAKWNHYGGWVCSRACDLKSSLELERSMPGHGSNQMAIGTFAQKSLKSNWD